MDLTSKLPRVGTTIFTIMSRRAAELGAINLGQGFPDYEMDPRLAELIYEAMRAGHNQYAPMPGLASLRETIATRLQARHGAVFDAEREITVTLGATEAIFSAVQALVGAGDEVIIFDPAYDSYEPAIELAGARCVHVPLEPPRFRHDWERIAAACNARTRLIIINSPHNPGCSCVSAEDLTALAELARRFDLALISDEVYEYIVFDGRQHHSVLAHPELRARSVAVYSFGKTLHATGLRVGYAVAAPALTAELRKVHQFNTFTIATALQWGIARYLAERPQTGADLSAFFAARRDRFIAAISAGDAASCAWSLPPSEGSFFQLLDYGQISGVPDVQFADELLTRAGVALIPVSVFYRQPPPGMTLVRACIAKREATLDAAAARLAAFAQAGWQADDRTAATCAAASAPAHAESRP
ncbi:MAG TPA: methionine aminotransferase [Steroidobacteraceae bacterium]|nr:methionine aminotransferase [Steroidobacteraceae bacterium]